MGAGGGGTDAEAERALKSGTLMQIRTVVNGAQTWAGDSSGT